MNFNVQKPLSSKELTQEFIKYKNGDKEARNKIISCNARLVIHIAQKYQNANMDLSDLFSIGLIGLIKAVDTFNIEKNFKFTTYAGVCINNEILMFLRKHKKHEKEVSLDASLRIGKDQDEASIENILENPNVNIIEDYEKKESIEEIKKIIWELPEREKEVVLLYFGFYDNKEYSQKEIASKLGISQSYASRILSRALKIIKSKMDPKISSNKKTTRKTSMEDKKEKSKTKTQKDVKTKEQDIEIIEFNLENLQQLEILKIPTNIELLSNFTSKEAVIISLTLGFINNRYYSIKEVSDFLKINEVEIKQIILNYLNLYKKSIHEFLQQVVELSQEKER